MKLIKEVLIAMAILLAFVADHSFAYAEGGFIYRGTAVSSQGDDWLEATNHQCLTMVMHLEARNQGARGAELVAMVTLNRVMDRRWSNSVCDVISEYSQYEPIVPEMKDIIARIKEGELFAFQDWVEENQVGPDVEVYHKNEFVAFNTMRRQGLDANWLDILYFYNPEALARRGQSTPGWVSRLDLVLVYKDHHFLADKRG